MTAIAMAFGVVYTFAHIYPINAILFSQGGGSAGADQVRDMVRTWIFADRLRFAVGLVGFVFLLKAFSTPVGRDRGRA